MEKHSVRQKRSKTSERFSPKRDQDKHNSVLPQDLAIMVAALVKSVLSELGVTKVPLHRVIQKNPQNL